jgi:uncharacterized protein
MNEFRPTGRQERFDLLDALRGFALCGILHANLEGFTGAYLLTPAELSAQPVARAVLFLNNWFIEGKFYALFSMLFGIGFALQTDRSRKAGVAFLPLWYRRMAALTNYISQNLIGVLLFYGYGFALIGKMPYALIPMLAAAVLAMQWLVCRWWLSRFAQGPLEFVWRKITYRNASA